MPFKLLFPVVKTWRRARQWAAVPLLAAGLAGVLQVSQAEAQTLPVAQSIQALPTEVQQAWAATKLPDSTLSLVVHELGGQRLASLNAMVPRNPASVMKMVTTWAALSELGPEYSWRTAFYTRADAQIDAEGTLTGPLYLKAGGDPFLTMQELWSLLRELRLRGVKNITEVVVDRSRFGDVALDPAAFDGAGDRPYNASPDVMMVGLGTVRLIFIPDTQANKWVPVIDPPVRGLRVQGNVEWSNARCPGSPQVSTQVQRLGTETLIQVNGTVAGSCGEFSLYRLALPQQQHFEAMFRMLWTELGGTLGRGFNTGSLPSNARLLAWHDSETLADTIRLINKQSNNVMARMLLLALGAEQRASGATAHSGAQAAFQVLRSQGVDTQGWVLENGSGLSRQERLTADGLASMLDVAWRSPLMPEFISSLAISGVDGTLRRRLRADETRGLAHLKTGTLRDSRALAGYVLGASGRRYALVLIINHERAGNTGKFLDSVVQWLAKQ
ncbi:D-alanyl-D-alanine carboxypeptidase/D-alanyl-D-alanine-endopeptidase [Achromobacter sp. F4_2707]|uniref:D-alanyl-D-alanine carboxypeptidase/D-alanyl-D-alanine endopeptidase n=1 Tax=Achromobacter sp. F4_2707 TaxID=3114286 RepID=UPI0039C673A2